MHAAACLAIPNPQSAQLILADQRLWRPEGFVCEYYARWLLGPRDETKKRRAGAESIEQESL